MTYKLFLDDIRDVNSVYPGDSGFVVVRTYKDFVNQIMANGLPYFISFDNDLGIDESGSTEYDGYKAAKWLVYESNLDLRKLRFAVHSANPVAKEQIKSLLENYISFLRKNSE